MYIFQQTVCKDEGQKFTSTCSNLELNLHLFFLTLYEKNVSVYGYVYLSIYIVMRGYGIY